jgi:hypothetical protein
MSGSSSVENIKVEIEDTQKAFDDLMDGVLPLQSGFIMPDKLVRSLPDLVNKPLQVGNDAAKNRDAIKGEIQNVIQEGS